MIEFSIGVVLQKLKTMSPMVFVRAVGIDGIRVDPLLTVSACGKCFRSEHGDSAVLGGP